MKTFRQYITEAKTAPLYHGTAFDNVHAILRDGKIKASSNGRVSTTRDIRSAGSAFATEAYFVLDQQKIGYRQKIKPTDWSTGGSVAHDKSQIEPTNLVGRRGEAEESIHGDIDLKNVIALVVKKEDWVKLTGPKTGKEKNLEKEVSATDDKMKWLYDGTSYKDRAKQAKSFKALLSKHKIKLILKN